MNEQEAKWLKQQQENEKQEEIARQIAREERERSIRERGGYYDADGSFHECGD